MFISNDYTSQFLGYSHAPIDRKVRYVNRFLRDSVEGIQIESVPFDVKCNILQDCFFLLSGDWQQERSIHSKLTDIKKLDPSILEKVINESKSPDVINKFITVLETTQRETFEGYERFISISSTKIERTGGEFLDWFYNGLPYLVVDFLFEDMEIIPNSGKFKIRDFGKVRQRIETMTEFCEDKSFDKLQLKEDALRYVYQWESNFIAPSH